MPLEPFGQSAALTFGVELELQLVNLSDYDLTAASPDLLHLLNKKPFPGNVTPEITESMIEINSSVHTHHGPLLEQLQEIRDTLITAGDKLNIGIAGGGTHPFQQWSSQKIFSKPASRKFRNCTATWPSSSPSSASACTSAAPRATTPCSCCIR